MNVKNGQVMLRCPTKKGEPPREFTFDAVYDWKYVLLCFKTVSSLLLQITLKIM